MNIKYFKVFLLSFLFIFFVTNVVIAQNEKSDKTVLDKGLFHIVKYKRIKPIVDIGKVGDRLLISFSSEEHEWLFNNNFVSVNGSDPAKILGYPTYENSVTLLKSPTKNACTGLKEVVSSIAITKTKNLCLTSSKGGDYVLYLMPDKKKLPVGFGKKFILEKNGLTWIGYDGNLYQAFIHPELFSETVSAIKYTKAPTVYLIKDGMKFQIPDEKTYFSWFSSWKDVKGVDAKTLAKYSLKGKISFKPNTIIKFTDEKELYVFQPKNDPYLTYGKDVTIVTEEIDSWEVKKLKNQTSEKMTKRPEVLRHIISIDDVEKTFGPNWQKRLIELPLTLKSKITIDEKDFIPETDILVEY